MYCGIPAGNSNTPFGKSLPAIVTTAVVSAASNRVSGSDSVMRTTNDCCNSGALSAMIVISMVPSVWPSSNAMLPRIGETSAAKEWFDS